VINQNLYPKLGFNPTEFVPIVIMGRVPNALVVNPAKVTAKKDLSKADRGLVTLERTVLNQRDEVVQQGETDLIVEKRR